MIELDVNNMTCGHRVAAVTHVVKRVDPQARVQIDALGEAGYPAAAAKGTAPAPVARRGCCS